MMRPHTSPCPCRDRFPANAAGQRTAAPAVVCLEGELDAKEIRRVLGAQAELLVGALAAHALRQQLAEDGDHGEAAVLELLQLLLLENLRTRRGQRGSAPHGPPTARAVLAEGKPRGRGTREEEVKARGEGS